MEAKRRARENDLEARRIAKEDDKVAKVKYREIEKVARGIRKQLETEIHKLRISTRLAVNSHVTSFHNLSTINTIHPTIDDLKPGDEQNDDDDEVRK